MGKRWMGAALEQAVGVDVYLGGDGRGSRSNLKRHILAARRSQIQKKTQDVSGGRDLETELV